MMPLGMRCKLHVGISAFITITRVMHWLYNLVLIEIFKKKLTEEYLYILVLLPLDFEKYY